MTHSIGSHSDAHKVQLSKGHSAHSASKSISKSKSETSEKLEKSKSSSSDSVNISSEAKSEESSDVNVPDWMKSGENSESGENEEVSENDKNNGNNGKRVRGDKDGDGVLDSTEKKEQKELEEEQEKAQEAEEQREAQEQVEQQQTQSSEEQPESEPSSDPDLSTNEERASAEASVEANTEYAQQQLAVEKEMAYSQKDEVREQINDISDKEGHQVEPGTLRDIARTLDELEAFEAGEDAARLARLTKFDDEGSEEQQANAKSAQELKKELLEKEETYRPQINKNWDDLLRQDCQAILEETRAANKGASGSDALVAPSGYKKVNPDGALGKLVKNFNTALKTTGEISTETKEMISQTLLNVGIEDWEELLRSTANKPMTDFSFRI